MYALRALVPVVAPCALGAVCAIGSGADPNPVRLAEGTSPVPVSRACPDPTAPALAPHGYLYEPALSVDHLLRLPARVYVPQAGDIFFSTDQRFVAKFAHTIVHSGAPHHSGIVFALPDGSPALLEGGPNGTTRIRVRDFTVQANSYFPENRVWIRQRSVPLTPEQSRRLTVFALCAADRPFAEMRLFSQANPLLRAKGPLRTRLFGRPHAAHFDPDNPEPGMRRKYFCSELVTEGCVAAGLLPPDTTRPMSMYPRELFFGTSRIPYIRDNLDMTDWLPPSRWTAAPGSEPVLRRFPVVEGDTGGIRGRP
jgi:hypothetical protein